MRPVSLCTAPSHLCLLPALSLLCRFVGPLIRCRSSGVVAVTTPATTGSGSASGVVALGSGDASGKSGAVSVGSGTASGE
jgi:hypothetical protein